MSGRPTSSERVLPRPSAASPLATPVQYLKGVGPSRAEALARLNIATIADLLYHVPRRHDDRSRLVSLRELTDGLEQTVEATVAAVSQYRPRRGLILVKAALTDHSGVAYAVWYNQTYIRRQLRRGMRALFYGRVDRRRGEIQIQSPEFEILDDDGDETWHTGRLVPIYRATEGVSQRVLRTLVRTALAEYAEAVPELLPETLRASRDLPPVGDALWGLHFPATRRAQEGARRRLAFEELLVLQLGVLLRRLAARRAKPHHYGDGDNEHRSGNGHLVQRFLASLPFPLTRAQQRVIDEIMTDLHAGTPMNRLLQGDVGSGKTVVAVATLLACVQGGHQGALMAPTEILAEQHYLTLRRLLDPLGVSVALLVGGRTVREREATRAALAAGEADIAVGTHALIEEAVGFERLSLAVIDEQHRFGVMQRARLRSKGGSPDVLVMTATPIPRTLALTLYGDLDTSVLDELPPGRSPVATYVRDAAARPKVYAFVREQIAAGRQAYVVCPLVLDSEKLQAQAAVRLAEELRSGPLDGLTVGLVHGRMPPEEKDRAMETLRTGQMQVLVATSVIEVGIDIPNASVMVIENADRFGLAQLHQLRGRVGRGPHRSFCILVASPTTAEGRRRLDVLAATTDGFQIAQEDLQLRGPGEIMGTRQHGLPDLKVADLATDLELMEDARAAAEEILASDPDLVAPPHLLLREAARDRFAGRGLATVG